MSNLARLGRRSEAYFGLCLTEIVTFQLSRERRNRFIARESGTSCNLLFGNSPALMILGDLAPSEPEITMAWKPRQHPRYKAALSLELRLKDTEAPPLRTQTADVGLGGCYVETFATQEVSTPVEITLWVGDSKINVAGEVVSKHPSFGNGYKFIRLRSEEH